jgi:hypothetical protein
MRAILLSSKPEQVAKILSGEKTIEIRKTMPKCELPIDVYIYCTKDQTRENDGNVIGRCYQPKTSLKVICGRGKVVCKFTLREVDKIMYFPQSLGLDERRKHGCYSCVFEDSNKRNFDKENYSDYFVDGSDDNYLVYGSKMKANQIHTYLRGKVGYSWEISDLEIFDKPKGLREFEKVGSYNNPTIKCKGKERGRCNRGISPFTGKLVGCEKARLTKAPQSWCYVEELK